MLLSVQIKDESTASDAWGWGGTTADGMETPIAEAWEWGEGGRHLEGSLIGVLSLMAPPTDAMSAEDFHCGMCEKFRHKGMQWFGLVCGIL